MVLLLNLIPVIAVVVLFYLLWEATKRRSVKMAVLTSIGFVLFFIVYTMALPSYLPKDEARNTLEIPELVVPAEPIQVQDRLLKPKVEENEQKHEEAFDWRKQIEANKGK